MKKSENPITNVEEYMAQFPVEVHERLELIRSWIITLVPDAVESISYGMPAWKYQKKPLVYFAAYEQHIGLYATPVTHEAFQEQLKSYKTGKGSVQFPHNQTLPERLIKDMILFRKEQIGGG